MSVRASFKKHLNNLNCKQANYNIRNDECLQRFCIFSLTYSPAQMRMDRDRFVVKLDVKHLSPNEPMVKINDDCIEIHGKRDERQVTKHKLTFILFTISEL